jgi:hypothetical protein
LAFLNTPSQRRLEHCNMKHMQEARISNRQVLLLEFMGVEEVWGEQCWRLPRW